MKSLAVIVILFVSLLSGQGYASPKVTQAASINFKVNRDVTAIAVEEFGKSPSLMLLHGKDIIYSTQFDDFFKSHDKFAYTNSFLRFKCFNINGLSNPILLAVAAAPGGSDESFEIKIIAEKDGKITSLNAKPIIITIQDGIFLGYINDTYGFGMITWKFQWDAAHYDPHRYEISISKWDKIKMAFIPAKQLTTDKKFKDGCTALKHYGLPCKNFRDEVIKVEEDISTLGIESEVLQPEAKNP